MTISDPFSLTYLRPRPEVVGGGGWEGRDLVVGDGHGIARTFAMFHKKCKWLSFV